MVFGVALFGMGGVGIISLEVQCDRICCRTYFSFVLKNMVLSSSLRTKIFKPEFLLSKLKFQHKAKAEVLRLDNQHYIISWVANLI